MSDGTEAARWRDFLERNLDVEAVLRSLGERYILEERRGGLLEVAGERPAVPAVPFIRTPEGREFRRHWATSPDRVRFEPLDLTRPADSFAPTRMIEQGMAVLLGSTGVPAGVFTGAADASTTFSAPSAESLMESVRQMRAAVPRREFEQEYMSEFVPPDPEYRVFSDRDLGRSIVRSVVDTGPVYTPPSPILVTSDLGMSSPTPSTENLEYVVTVGRPDGSPAPPGDPTVGVRGVPHEFEINFDDVRARGATFVGLDRAEEGSRDQSVEVSMTVAPDGTTTLNDVRPVARWSRDASPELRAADVPDNLHEILADEVLRQQMRESLGVYRAEYERVFGHPLTDDEMDFMELLRVDLERACPTWTLGSADVLRYLRQYDRWRNPPRTFAVTDGQVTAVRTVVDGSGVVTENVSVEIQTSRDADAVTGDPASNRRGDVFDAELLRGVIRQQYTTPETVAAVDAFWRCREVRDAMAVMVEQFAPAAAEAMRAQVEAAETPEAAAALTRRLADLDGDRRPARLPVLRHLVMRRDMRELTMDEVRLWTGSARSDASPEGLAFTRSQSIAPPPLYPGVQKAAWSSDEVAARQRNAAQRSDQVENLLARLREVLVARDLEPDLFKYTINASSPVVNNCRVFVFRVLQLDAGDLVEVLCVRILQKINDRGSSDWGYQVTEGNRRRVSRPLRPYVSQEALYRERQQAARQDRASGQARAEAEDRRRDREESDRAAQARVAAARARATARQQPQGPISVQPEVPRPEDFRPGLDL